MDSYIHTIIAVSLMYLSYKVGRYFGNQDGISDMVQTLLKIFNADSMEINEDGEFYITTNGQTKKVN